MWGNQQNTLPVSWRQKQQQRSDGDSGEVSNKRGAGRARGRGKSVSGGPGSSSSRGSKSGSGRGRGRGRGKNATKFMDNSTYGVDEDDDELCQQALGQYELANSDISKAFANSRNLTEIPGFDGSAGDVWIYPTNRPVRDYQFNITQTSLFHNTLVCLPTGLGKTFIAAVVMYNFHRWYPNDLIIFMAPTRPLVTQQLDACHNIVGIDPNKTVELTGQILPTKREAFWEEKKVFFLTPQVIQSDIARKSCPAERIRCVVIDEAHKALGNHSYGQVIAAIFNVNKHFRVLGLSATPGNDLIAIQQVFRNLMISKVELRSDNSPDILPYIHNKEVETIVVSLDPFLQNIHSKVQELYQIYTGKLMKKKILPYNGSNFVAFQLLQARQRFRMTMAANMPSFEKGQIEVTFSNCISLSRAIDLLQYHGLRSFYLFIQGLLLREKGSAAVAAELKRQGIEEILESIKNHLNICLENSSFNISTSALFDSISEEPDHLLLDQKSTNIDDYLRSHPKLIALKNIVDSHFKSSSKNTRIMIFSQYRDSVQEIGNLLGLIPNVKPMVFMGQAKTTGAGGRGLKQKEQVQVVEKFRNGEFNVLVATSVGEEGLDIGEVDLIICFDSNKSPTRNIQRMGRTGRQRQGRIIFLLTEGKEERMYKSSVYKQTNVSKNITDPDKLSPFLFDVSPRMIPTGIDPQCFKMNIILSSEQTLLADKTLLGSPQELSTFDESDFLRPSKAQKQDKKTGKKGQLTRTKSSSSISSSPKNTNTLQQFVQRMELKKMQATKASSASIVETITLEDSMDVPDDDYQYGHSPPDHGMVCGGGHDVEEYEVMRSIFDLHDFDANSVAPSCVYIPQLDPPLGWNTNVKNGYSSLDFLSLSEIQCLHEQVDSSVYLVDDRFCRCGFVSLGSTPSDFAEPCDRGNVSSSKEIPSCNQSKLAHSAAPRLSPKSVNPFMDESDFGEISPNQWDAWEELPDKLSPKKRNTDSKGTVECDNFNLDDGFVFEDDWELDESVLHNNNDKNMKTPKNQNTNCAEFEKNKSISAELNRQYPKRVLLEKNQVPMETDKPKSNINHKESEDSTASESEWNTPDEFEQRFKPARATTDTAFSTPLNNIKSSSRSPSEKYTPVLNENSDAIPPDDQHRGHSGSEDEPFSRKSQDTSIRKKFTFKKKPIAFVTSFHSPNIDPIMDCTIKSAKTAAGNIAQQSSDSSVPAYRIKQSHPAVFLSPAESEIDCIPATSSEDEEPAPVSRSKKIPVIPEEKDESSDTDATQWDPEEADGFPSSIGLSETVPSHRFNDAFSFSSVVKEPQVPHAKMELVRSATKLLELPKQAKTSPASWNQRIQKSSPAAGPSLWQGLQSASASRTSTPLHSKSTFYLGDENSEPDLTRTPKRVSILGQGSSRSRKACLSRESRNLLKTLSSSSSSSAPFSSEIPTEQPGTSASKPKFQFRRKKEETNAINMAAAGSFMQGGAETSSITSPAIINKTNEAFDSDDDCFFVCEKQISPSPVRAPIPVQSFSESPDDVIVRRKNNVKRRIIRSTERPEPVPRIAPKSQSRKQKKKNPFVWDEAVDASGSDSGGDEVDLGEDLRSFVVDEDDEDDCIVSLSQQQAMYMQSVKDVAPLKRGRIEVPIPRVIDEDDEEYDLNDSFCTNDVEYMDVGVFTQCMIEAREEIEKEKTTGKPTRKLRSRRK